jgi:hypothetical protein
MTTADQKLGPPTPATQTVEETTSKPCAISKPALSNTSATSSSLHDGTRGAQEAVGRGMAIAGLIMNGLVLLGVFLIGLFFLLSFFGVLGTGLLYSGR